MSLHRLFFNAFTLLVGTRYGISRKHSQLVSFISRLSTAGLVIGVALLIVVMSVMNGFDRELRERILGIMPQATIYHRDGIQNPAAAIATLKQDKRIVDASPFVQLQGLLSYQKHHAPVNLFGVNPALQAKMTVLEQYLPEGAFSLLASDAQAVIIGQGVAQKLQATVGDTITLIVPRASDTDAAPSVAMLKIIAILKSNTEVDQAIGFMNLEAASAVSEFPGSATGIRLQITDLFSASEIVLNAVNQLPAGYYGSDWTRTHGNIYQAIQMSKQLVSMLLFLIIAIAAFNVVSTLIMVVVDKQGDIAILRTLGASSAEIIGIFMVQGGLIGLIGTSIGVLVGVALSFVVTTIIQAFENITGIQFLHSDVYPISYLPSDLYWSDVAFVASASLIICFFASFYPAWRASRIQPADALRYN